MTKLIPLLVKFAVTSFLIFIFNIFLSVSDLCTLCTIKHDNNICCNCTSEAATDCDRLDSRTGPESSYCSQRTTSVHTQSPNTGPVRLPCTYSVYTRPPANSPPHCTRPSCTCSTPTCRLNTQHTQLVAWHGGRTSVFGRRTTFSVLRSTCSWRVTTYVGKPSAMGQPTRPTQPFIPSGSIDE